MPDARLFDLMDIDNEPTDEQLAQLMKYFAEAVQERKKLSDQNLRNSLAAELEKITLRSPTAAK